MAHPQNEDDLKNGDFNLKNEDCYLKYEDNLKYEDDFKYEDELKYEDNINEIKSTEPNIPNWTKNTEPKQQKQSTKIKFISQIGK